MHFRFRFITLLVLFTMSQLLVKTATAKSVTVTISNLLEVQKEGRLYLIFSRSMEQEPRMYSAWPTKDIEPLFSKDLSGLSKGQIITFDTSTKGFPFDSLADLPAGKWYVQAIYDSYFLDSRINSPLNIYSDVVEYTSGASSDMSLALSLNQRLPKESLPDDDKFLKFVKMPSQKLSEFWGTDMYLRAGVILPNSYYDNPLKDFPVIFNVGGYHARYERAQRLYEDEAFKQFWFESDTPQMVIVFLDGEAPLGDPYQIDSANNGPYGQATWQEFLPYLTKQFNLVDNANSRFVSGCSTGGWVSLALQTYYPDLFNGAWSFSADGVDFKYFQLIDIYQDENAFVNEHGMQRPSYRAKDGETIFSIKREIMMENQIGRNDSFIYSGGQWGGWNAVFGPKLEDGTPSTIWDPLTGKIDQSIAAQWTKYDLRLYTEKNWQTLGPKLQGKLNIWMGDMDNFYLNNAMHLYQEMLNTQKEPVSNAEFTWVRGAGHCDYKQVPMLKKIMIQMQQKLP
ncbi:MAG: hypothetical protein ACJAUL_004073 [Paraglaciecola sp.]|jgi:hypothetical protein